MDGCDHPVRVAGMCAVCGKAVEDAPDTHEGSPQLHDISGVQVSSAEAARLDSESTRHLLSQRKLALIVDLDQTIIHATVDPTVGEWMKDTKNPNHRALKNVGKFFLGVDGKAVIEPVSAAEDEAREESGGSDEGSPNNAGTDQHGDGCWYYVKPRPGLQRFLQELSERYEMHVYTMGTRTYAESVCKLVDPHGAIFGARITSRDENGSLLQKSLKKLFPMDTSMVIIIDDRADVWQWSPNLLRVSPFDFFVGIGDINATFLPSLPPTPTSATPSEISSSTSVGASSSEPSSSAPTSGAGSTEGPAAAAASGGDSSSPAAPEAQARTEREEDDAAKNVAAESQKSAVNEQLDMRPLAKMQEALDDQTAAQQHASEGVQAVEENTSASTTSGPETAAVLREDDMELQRLRSILDDVHERWYSAWGSHPVKGDDKPAITSIIAGIKGAVLAGCVIVFSSVAPVHQDPSTTDLWRMATEFGATCKRALDSTATHVVAAKQGTEKVLSAQRRGIHVVWCSWLHDSCLQWKRLPEEMYSLPSQAHFRHDEDADDASHPAHGDTYDENENDEEDNMTASESYLEDGTASDYAGGEGSEQGFGDMNWDEANDEIDAVLAGLSDDDDEDTTDAESAFQRGEEESDSEDAGDPPQSTTKRARPVDGDYNGDAGDSDDDNVRQNGRPTAEEASAALTLSPLSKRRRITEMRAGQSKLKQSMLQSEGDAGEHKQDNGDCVGQELSHQDAKETPSAQGDADFLQSLEDELALQLNEDGESVSSDKVSISSKDANTMASQSTSTPAVPETVAKIADGE